MTDFDDIHRQIDGDDDDEEKSDGDDDDDGTKTDPGDDDLGDEAGERVGEHEEDQDSEI
jgi:hypothetical protein